MFVLVSAVAWHPIHEGLFVSGGSEGALMFWMVGYVIYHEEEVDLLLVIWASQQLQLQT